MLVDFDCSTVDFIGQVSKIGFGKIMAVVG